MSTVSIRRWTAQSFGQLDFPSDSCAKDVAGKAVQMGLEKLGVPESAMGTATALAGEAFDRLGDAAFAPSQPQGPLVL